MIIAINVLGGLGLFLFGMMVMSEGLQKVAGRRLRSAMRALTSNRFAGVLTGFGVTAVIQSSSATTVMLVSFVNAGLVTLTQSIGVIMGANIGTTVTGWLVALLGFKVKINLIALVGVGIGFTMRLIGKKSIPYWGEVLIGFGLIFIGLDFMKDAVSGLRGSQAFLDMMSSFDAEHIPGLLAAIGIGSLVTVVIQSSSATMALTMTLAAQGLINFPTAAALILGENIGTTITANLAAIGASRNAKRTAFAHFLFNLCGVLWMIALFGPFRHLVDSIVPGDPAVSVAAIPGHMAMFHTLFNITNTAIFLPLVGILVAVVLKAIPKRNKPEVETLKYIDAKVIATPGLALESTRLELYKMADNVRAMFSDIKQLIENPGEVDEAKAEEILNYERTTDDQKEVITAFLRRVIQLAATEQQGIEVTRLLSHVSDFERMGDHCRNLLRVLQKIHEQEIPMPLEAHTDLMGIAAKCMEFLETISAGLKRPGRSIMDQARALETEINDLRASGKNNHRVRLIQNTCDIQSGLLFLDMLTNFEKIGDHAFNIAQRISGEK